MNTWGHKCPDGNHGRLLDWTSERYGWFCPHEAHGGNGRFLTTAEAEASTPAHELPVRGLTPAPQATG